MAGPILEKFELKRLPFQRRPIAEPGTTLVFQMADNRLVPTQYPFTTGETIWKGPKWAFVVDVRQYNATFPCQLPAAGDGVFFQATVNFTWSVSDAVQVVEKNVTDPEGECRTYLFQVLPQITRRHAFRQPAEAEADLQRTLAGRALELRGRGVRIDGVYMHLRIAEEQITTIAKLSVTDVEQELAVKQAKNSGTLTIMTTKQMEELMNGGPKTLYAFAVQRDPGQALDVIARMEALEDRNKQHALEAIKVLLDGGEIRLGELDDAVAAAVTGFRAILGPYASGKAAGADKALPPGSSGEQMSES
jgi:hypothetical protein